MVQDRTNRHTPCRGGRVLRLLLAVLLTLSPLLATAQLVVPAPANDVDAVSHMPCHPGGGQALPAADPPATDACPHCTGDAPASQCHCCGYAAPAGLSAVPDTPTAVRGPLTQRLARTPGALPESPRDDLLRPPISSS